MRRPVSPANNHVSHGANILAGLIAKYRVSKTYRKTRKNLTSQGQSENCPVTQIFGKIVLLDRRPTRQAPLYMKYTNPTRLSKFSELTLQESHKLLEKYHEPAKKILIFAASWNENIIWSSSSKLAPRDILVLNFSKNKNQVFLQVRFSSKNSMKTCANLSRSSAFYTQKLRVKFVSILGHEKPLVKTHMVKARRVFNSSSHWRSVPNHSFASSCSRSPRSTADWIAASHLSASCKAGKSVYCASRKLFWLTTLTMTENINFIFKNFRLDFKRKNQKTRDLLSINTFLPILSKIRKSVSQSEALKSRERQKTNRPSHVFIPNHLKFKRVGGENLRPERPIFIKITRKDKKYYAGILTQNLRAKIFIKDLCNLIPPRKMFLPRFYQMFFPRFFQMFFPRFFQMFSPRLYRISNIENKYGHENSSIKINTLSSRSSLDFLHEQSLWESLKKPRSEQGVEQFENEQARKRSWRARVNSARPLAAGAPTRESPLVTRPLGKNEPKSNQVKGKLTTRTLLARKLENP